MRLVGAAPSLASASVSLNTSVLHFGQAVGSAIGGFLYVRDLLYAAVMWRRPLSRWRSHMVVQNSRSAQTPA
jgi:predicted MFS family arabinose efflux permease